VKWLLTGIAERLLGKLYTDTNWEDNNEKSFDGLLIRARTVVVFEFKGGFLTQEVRYSSDPEKFVDDLKLKFGKGGNQLSRDIGQSFPPGKEGRQLLDVAVPPKVEFVLPILVVQDAMLRLPFVHYFLNQEFQNARSLSPVRNGIEVLPLKVIQITSLEGLVEMADVLGLDIVSTLFRRSRTDPTMLLFLNDFLETIPEMQQPHRSARFDKIFEKAEHEMSMLLTGREPGVREG
jgi:hypothetical protein